MKALVYVGPEKVEVRDVELPQLKEGYARIKVKYCGICGSDIGIFLGTHPRAKAPLILGHEFIGIIKELKGSTGQFAVGDRVAAYPLLSCGKCVPCRTGNEHVCKKLGLIGIDIDGGIAEYVDVSEDALYSIDASVSDKAAATVEPLAVIVRSVHQAGYKPFDSTVIIGAGPIGILTGILLKHLSASKIIISDIDKARLDMCRKLGLETVDVTKTDLVGYVNEATDGNGVDIVFECSGFEDAALQASKLAKITGMICMTGIHKAPHKVNLQDINFKEQRMIGTRVYTRREFGQAIELTKIISNEIEKIVTNIIGWDEADKVFDYIKDPNINTIKVLVDCER